MLLSKTPCLPEYAHIAIIGGGAAGICAALGARAQLRRHGIPDAQTSICIFERNPELGIKIRISGGGKCNITHAGEMMSVLSEGFFRQNEQRFLKPAFYGLTNSDVLQWLRERGVETYTRPNGRVFPTSGKALDVLSAFKRLLSEHEIQVFPNVHISSVSRKGNMFAVAMGDAVVKAAQVIIATGGVSYSKVGTTGDGLRFAKAFGHTVVTPYAALAPIYFTKPPDAELVGVSLRQVGLLARASRVIASRMDDVLITHLGVSGPACLSLSREIALVCTSSAVDLCVNFFPKFSADDLHAKLLQLQQDHPTQFVRTFLEQQFPDAVVPFIFRAANVPVEQKWNNFTKDKRRALVETLSCFFLGRVKDVPIERGEVSAGGVALSEVNPKTMESRLVANLYFAGEVLDVAGEVGGFNLQAAYSTGWVAGQTAAGKLCV
jgi:predicted Rossmann fold flavoprotein